MRGSPKHYRRATHRETGTTANFRPPRSRTHLPYGTALQILSGISHGKAADNRTAPVAQGGVFGALRLFSSVVPPQSQGATNKKPRAEICAHLKAYYYGEDHPMPSTPPLIHVDHVSRDYRLGETVIRAVNDLSLEICSGEFLALLGSSGSGKSTLLNLMAGLDRPTAGAIHVQEKNLAALDSQGLARYRRETVGMVFQSFNLLPRMTLEENVELPLRLAEIDRSERSRRVAQALDRVRLGARSKHRPSELSGGEQQRGALARALVNQPTILFADEPTGNLDSTTGEQILLLLREIQDTLGMTIIMVTHERPLAERFANRIAVLSDGKLKDHFAMQAGARA